MLILAIESSCDETAAAVCEERRILSSVINTQIEEHKKFGGVVPEVASRRHCENIAEVVSKALSDAGKTYSDIDAVAVTFAPGLIGALLVGVNFAKGLALSLNVPLIPVHHLRSHIAANYINNEELKPPFLCLTVSGGNSIITDVEDYTAFKLIGGFSGLKTAVLNLLNNSAQKGEEIDVPVLAATLRQKVCDILIENTFKAAEALNRKTLVLAGGVSANSELRARMKAECEKRGIKLYYPELKYCGDNAAMVGVQAFYEYQSGNTAGASLNATATLPIDYRK